MRSRMIAAQFISGLVILTAVTDLAMAQVDPAPAQPSSGQPAAVQPVLTQQAPAPEPASPQASVWDLLKSARAMAEGKGVEKNPAKARDLFEQVMASDNKEVAGAAALDLAKLAEGDLQDPDLAVRALERGIALGNPWCMLRRAAMLANGDPAAQKQSADLYQRVIDLQDPSSQKLAYHALGKLYLSPGMLSPEKAQDYLQRAAGAGNAWSMLALSDMYDKGTVTGRNWTMARDYAEKALASEEPQAKGAAARALAQLYVQEGHSEPERSFNYLLEAQKNGDLRSTILLADRYAKGLGVEKNAATARDLFEQVMASDNKEMAGAAALGLAKLAEGDLQDPDLAVRALERGIALGDPWSMMRRAAMLANGDPAAQKQSADLYQRVIDLQDPNLQKFAYHALGKLYLSPGMLSPEKAQDYLQRAAGAGNAWSMLALSDMYDKGTVTGRNWTMARDYAEKALASEEPQAKGAAARALAQLYVQEGYSEPERSFNYLLEAQKNGDLRSTMLLADRYAKGLGVEKSTATARRMLTELRDNPDQDISRSAAFKLGRLYDSDRPRDIKLAEENYSYAAGRGEKWASYSLARLYLQDMPSKANRRKARELLLDLSAGDDPELQKAANYTLGKLYLSPGMLSPEKARDHLQRSAEAGNAWSLIALSGIYDKGTGTKRNWTKARDYAEKALASGEPQVKGAAARALAQLYLQKGHRAPKTSFNYLLEGHKNGDVWATMLLADHYAKGLGVRKSTATARRLLSELRNNPDRDVSRFAAFRLGRLYDTGRPRNIKLAAQNYRYAAGKGDIWASYSLARLYVQDMPTKANRRKARELLRYVSRNGDPVARKAANGLLKQLR